MSQSDKTDECRDENGDASLPFFSSRRERRLWLWTALVVAAIYSTLGLATTLAGVLRDTGLLNAAFVFAGVLILVTIVTMGLKTRPRGLEIGVAAGIVAAYLLVFVRMAIPEERSHLMEYGVVAILVYEALTERASRGRRVPWPALLAVLTTTVIGTFDEMIQAVLPNRVFGWQDILFNLLAGVMAVAACVALGWARRKTSGKHETT